MCTKLETAPRGAGWLCSGLEYHHPSLSNPPALWRPVSQRWTTSPTNNSQQLSSILRRILFRACRSTGKASAPFLLPNVPVHRITLHITIASQALCLRSVLRFDVCRLFQSLMWLKPKKFLFQSMIGLRLPPASFTSVWAISTELTWPRTWMTC